jgi:hypothetical protein
MTKHKRWKKEEPQAKNPAAQQLGTLGGSRNTPAQVAARLANAKLAGRPRRVCTVCGEPVYGGHKRRSLDRSCGGTAWEWQTPSEKRAAAKTKKGAA